MVSNALIAKTPREQSGAQSYRAFDFQVHVSMARILDAYAKGEDFAAYFDFFDDLVFAHQEGDQTVLSFYQVKARSGSAWTPTLPIIQNIGRFPGLDILVPPPCRIDGLGPSTGLALSFAVDVLAEHFVGRFQPKPTFRFKG